MKVLVVGLVARYLHRSGKVLDLVDCWATRSWTKDPHLESSGVLCPYTLSGSVVR